MNKILLVVFASILASGCYSRSKVNTPVGEKYSTNIAGGLIHFDDLDTLTAFEQNCRQWLKPGLPTDPVTGRPADMALPDREIYQTCFANHMMPVEPMGQQSAPRPVDVDGNGHTDYFQYGGVYIPANVVNAYGIPGYTGMIPGSSYGVVGSYGPTGMYFPGGSNIDGSTMDPRMMQVQQVPAQATPAPTAKSDVGQNPWQQGKADGKEPATKEEVDALARQMMRISEQQQRLNSAGK